MNITLERPEYLEISLNPEGKLTNTNKLELHKYGIYIFFCGKALIRVGESASGFARIKKGFSQPLRKNKKKNYYAYHWRDGYRNKKIIIRYFPLDGEEAKKPEIRRAIEAEVTLRIRLKLDKWPLRMTEIHFSEELRKIEEIKDIVKKIIKIIKI